MRASLLNILTCPACSETEPDLVLEEEEKQGEETWTGTLTCPDCGAVYPILRGVPRFVAAETTYSDYADNFSFEWNRWGRVQIDRYAGHGLSEKRFLADSRWSPDWMKGKLILDAGCGAGRFADVAAKQGAHMVAMDLSGAVDACKANTADHAEKGNPVEVVQASFYAMPFKKGVFDGLYCMGVIQHTPDPERTMQALPPYLKPGGSLAYNWYEVSAMTKLQPIKYALRFVTPRLPHVFNHYFSLLLTLLFFPISVVLQHIPKVRIINAALPICASHDPALSLKQQFVWTLLDTFDWYSPVYEHRQSKARVAELLTEMGLKDVATDDGLGWAKKASDEPK